MSADSFKVKDEIIAESSIENKRYHIKCNRPIYSSGIITLEMKLGRMIKKEYPEATHVTIVGIAIPMKVDYYIPAKKRPRKNPSDTIVKNHLKNLDL